MARADNRGFFRRLADVFERGFTVFCIVAIIPACMLMEGCQTIGIRPPPGTHPVSVLMEVTGYDSGPISCEWTRDWLGRPVHSTGPRKGMPKKVGITASGARARHGTVAADPRYYPFGTVLYVPGYGYGRVEDTGGAIKGPNKLDIWFPTERDAKHWGRKRNVRTTVWKNW